MPQKKKTQKGLKIPKTPTRQTLFYWLMIEWVDPAKKLNSEVNERNGDEEEKLKCLTVL